MFKLIIINIQNNKFKITILINNVPKFHKIEGHTKGTLLNLKFKL